MGLDPKDVTAIIVTRGDVDLEPILATLPYGEIIVWDNSKRPVDRGVYGRYEAIAEASNDIIYFQDDDIIFTAHDELLAAYEPGKIVSNMGREWVESCGYFDLALVGLGSLVDKGLISRTFDRWFEVNDDSGNFIYECDFVFGVLCPFKRVDLGAEILDVASAPNRLWAQGWQMEAKWDFIKRARALRKITLALMVKNEEEHIRAAIKSCEGLVDNVAIVDTGSTDETIGVALDACHALGLPCVVWERPWVNFGHNRNELVERASQLGDYLLLMDGDETLEWGDNERKWPELAADAYYLYYSGPTTYAHPRLVRSGVGWRYSSGVHSTIEPVGQDIDPPLLSCLEFLERPLVVHHGNARHVMEKLEADVLQLTEMIFDDPHNTRAVFHLAKAIEGLGYRGEALEAYRRCISMSDWDEERFYCKYRMGMLECSEVGFDVGVETLLGAWRDRPWRAEPIRAIALACNEIADNMPLPVGEILMVHRDAYRVVETVGSADKDVGTLADQEGM